MAVPPAQTPLGISPPCFDVAFICTGNRARSPFAAELLRRHAGPLPVAVRSFGTLHVGQLPVLPKALSAAESLGVDLSRHRARPLVKGTLASTDLVVGFEPFHVASAVVTGEAVRERTFLITELAQLLDACRMSWDRRAVELRPQDIIELAHAMRMEKPLFPRSVTDPVGASTAGFRVTFEQISSFVAAIAVGILGDSTIGARV